MVDTLNESLWIGAIILWSMLVFSAGMVVGSYVVKKTKETRHWDGE